MARLVRESVFLLSLAVFMNPLPSQEAGVGVETPLWVRLQAPLISTNAAVGTAVDAVVVQPLVKSNRLLVPMGTHVRGTVAKPAAEIVKRDRAHVLIDFGVLVLDGQETSFEARVAAVDNARESVDDTGVILGLEPIRRTPSKVEWLLLAAAHAHPFAIAAVEGTKLILHEIDRPEISYQRGVDVALRIEKISVPARGMPALKSQPPGLADLIQTLPNRTHAAHSDVPSDWINLAFVGGEASLSSAFFDAGWDTASNLGFRSEAKTLFALAEKHAYQEAPVSLLLLSGRPPHLVFQKQNNTFAKRHHIRIWSSGMEWQGQPVWLAAATHDIGIDFSRQAKTFTHKVDPHVDLERTRVINDLAFVGSASLTALIDRSSVPSKSHNATGDDIFTDGRLAVLTLAQ